MNHINLSTISVETLSTTTELHSYTNVNCESHEMQMDHSMDLDNSSIIEHVEFVPDVQNNHYHLEVEHTSLPTSNEKNPVNAGTHEIDRSSDIKCETDIKHETNPVLMEEIIPIQSLSVSNATILFLRA